MGMKFIADLHIHSHFSRATSKALDPEHLCLWAQKKGIAVIGTGDFTHPGWVAELQEKLIEEERGLYRLKPHLQEMVDSQIPHSCPGPTRFLLSGEISCIYKKNSKTRKVHNLILMPDMSSVIKLNKRLDRIGNITSDGRPILGLDSRELLEITLETSDRAFFIPAHVWTPWFSVFGSKSGFDTLEECFEDLTDHIHALETGLSSDPSMNRLLSAIDDYVLVSNSDAHSPAKLGREANIFDTDMDYGEMTRAMIDGEGFLGTVEFYPEEGKYHLDGHRKCDTRLSPQETIQHKGICPVCGKPLTIGVLHRVLDLADRDTPLLTKDYFSLIPLQEVLSELLGSGPFTKKVMSQYEQLLVELGPELQILMDTAAGDIERTGGPVLAEAVERMRRNQVIREEGYDGEYGTIRLFDEAEKQAIAGQMALFAPSREKSTDQKILPPVSKKAGVKAQTPIVKEPVLQIDPILSHLNPEQEEAVLQDGGHLLVVAGPGTGKTMTLTNKIAYLIRSGLSDPEQILALTFTRKAAREMEQRISKLVEELGFKEVQVGTFHGFCLDILRNEKDKTDLPIDFTLCSEVDAENIAKEILEGSKGGKRLARRFQKALPDMKKASLPGLGGKLLDQDLHPLFEKYQRRLRDLGMLDLDDLEVETLRLFGDYPEIPLKYSKRFPRVFVDEYQDTNHVQVAILKKLIQADSGIICAIGDSDQAIYGFRGADVKNFHRFKEDFPGAREVVLSRNYRSTKIILQASVAVMGKDKPLKCESLGKEPVLIAQCRTESEEAEMIVEQVERLIGGTTYFSLDSGRVDSHEGELSLGFGDIGVLFRLNAQGEALEEALDRSGIPFVRSGQAPLINRYPINILWRFFQHLESPDSLFYAKRYQEVLADTGLRKKSSIEGFQAPNSLVDIVDQAIAFHELDCSLREAEEAIRILKRLAAGFKDMKTFLDALSLERGIDHVVLAGDRVALMSLHAAKGLEWPVVFITGCEDRLLPCSLFGTREDEEERRLFYVGMTRARSRLILSHVGRRKITGRIMTMRPSPFLDDIPEELLNPLDRRKWKPKGAAHQQLDLFK
jgi:DNA helicase-2/ATP-dependent DNA helicase PcrA